MKNMLSFVKGKSRAIVVSMMVSMMAVLSAVSASATDGTATTAELETAFSTALSNLQSDILGYVALALPVGLSILGITIAIKKGINFAKGLIGKS